MGVFDRAIAGSGGEHAYLEPETFKANTPLGSHQGATDRTRRSETPGRYRFILVPRGSSGPEWVA
jgi:hypothetical protein